MDKRGVKGGLTQCGPHLLVSPFVDDKEMGTPQLKSGYYSWLIVSLDYWRLLGGTPSTPGDPLTPKSKSTGTLTVYSYSRI